jgi:hypothetical protein
MNNLKFADTYIEHTIEPCLPFYARSPNKVVEYYYEDFDDGCGHTAVLRKVVYFDTKKKKTHEATAQVIWNA